MQNPVLSKRNAFTTLSEKDTANDFDRQNGQNRVSRLEGPDNSKKQEKPGRTDQ